ncbi:carbonic anhydrase 4-like isoform 2-T2 [Discoglossus pictus]
MGTQVQNTLLTITNNGHSADVSVSDGVTVSGGGLPSIYTTKSLHFHWGNGSRPGSEHQLSGKQYPMEMHIVHVKGNMTLTDAKKDSTGIAVLGFFIDVDDSANSSRLDNLANFLTQISLPGQMMNLSSYFSVDSLLGSVDRTQYYRYLGSLTTPTCDEAAIWTVFKNAIKVPSSVIKAFTSSIQHNVSGEMETLINNFRPPQALNSRLIEASLAVSPLFNVSTTSTTSTTTKATSTTRATSRVTSVLRATSASSSHTTSRANRPDSVLNLMVPISLLVLLAQWSSSQR